MRKILTTILLTFLLLILEIICSNVLGRFGKVNFLLLGVIYFNLVWGVRYSLLAAVVAGVFLDSLAVTPWGLNIFCFVVVAYLTTFIKRYLFHMGYGTLRVALVLFLYLVNVSLLFLLNSLWMELNAWHLFKFVLLPEILVTTMLAEPVFRSLKGCVLKLSA